jgi:hypothetical protein
MDVYAIGDVGEILKSNTYPGRGIIAGETSDCKNAAAAYFIMGRSENSRNRIFVERNGEVTIYPFDESKVSDPSLIIYSPVRKYRNSLIVTNGDQTDTVLEGLKNGLSFSESLKSRSFEPDVPNFTPRISAILNFADGAFDYEMSILKSADALGSACSRYNFAYAPLGGLGHFIHTYNSDGNPVPTFTGEPERVAIPCNLDEFANGIWSNLNEFNKVSLYACFVSLENGKIESRLFNKNVKA